MTYKFDKLTERRGTNSYKWDAAPEGVLPLWVADMDFETAPVIVSALQRRVAHGIFGYTRVPDEYYETVAEWFQRDAIPVEPEDLSLTNEMIIHFKQGGV